MRTCRCDVGVGVGSSVRKEDASTILSVCAFGLGRKRVGPIPHDALREQDEDDCMGRVEIRTCMTDANDDEGEVDVAEVRRWCRDDVEGMARSEAKPNWSSSSGKRSRFSQKKKERNRDCALFSLRSRLGPPRDTHTNAPTRTRTRTEFLNFAVGRELIENGLLFFSTLQRRTSAQRARLASNLYRVFPNFFSLLFIFCIE